MWKWSGLMSIPMDKDLTKRIVCMEPYEEHDYPECSVDPYTIMKKLGKENSAHYKHLPIFTDVYEALYAPTPEPYHYYPKYYNQPWNFWGFDQSDSDLDSNLESESSGDNDLVEIEIDNDGSGSGDGSGDGSGYGHTDFFG